MTRPVRVRDSLQLSRKKSKKAFKQDEDNILRQQHKSSMSLAWVLRSLQLYNNNISDGLMRSKEQKFPFVKKKSYGHLFITNENFHTGKPWFFILQKHPWFKPMKMIPLIIFVGKWPSDVTPLLTQRNYISFAPAHKFIVTMDTIWAYFNTTSSDTRCMILKRLWWFIYKRWQPLTNFIKISHFSDLAILITISNKQDFHNLDTYVKTGLKTDRD